MTTLDETILALNVVLSNRFLPEVEVIVNVPRDLYDQRLILYGCIFNIEFDWPYCYLLSRSIATFLRRVSMRVSLLF